MADYHVRKLERSLDPYEQEKLRRTQCRYKGCAEYKVRFARTYEDHYTRTRRVYVSVLFGVTAFAIQGDVRIEVFQLRPELFKHMIYQIANDLSVCPNCNSKSNKQEHFYKAICSYVRL